MISDVVNIEQTPTAAQTRARALRAKDGEFFISDWLRNRNTVEFLGIWASVFNPNFNYGEFAAIKSEAGLNSYKISVKEWVAKTNAIGLKAATGRNDDKFRPFRAWTLCCRQTQGVALGFPILPRWGNSQTIASAQNTLKHKAPKGRTVIALGNALGLKREEPKALKGRDICGLHAYA